MKSFAFKRNDVVIPVPFPMRASAQGYTSFLSHVVAGSWDTVEVMETIEKPGKVNLWQFFPFLSSRFVYTPSTQ
jgi:hypothetical protein